MSIKNSRYGRNIFYQNDGSGAGGGNNEQTDWKAKFEALNAQIAGGQYVGKDAYVTLQQKLEAAVNDKKAAEGNLSTATAKLALANEGQSTLQQQIAQLQTETSTLKADVDAKGAKIERHSVIFKQFPELAPFEADGLLPTPGEGQKLDEVLKAFSEKVSSIATGKLDEFKKTSTPPPPPPTDQAPKGAAGLLKEANLLLSQGKTSEYNTKMDEYHAAKKLAATA